MKKFLIFSTILFCSLFVIDKVGATSLTAYYDSEYVQDELLPATDLDYLNNDLIPFINENFNNYFVSIILSKSSNNSYSVGYIYIMPRNTANNGAVFMYLNNGYTSKLDFFPYTTIDSDYVVSGRVRGFTRFDYRTDNNNLTDNLTNVITALQNWLNNPTYSSPNDFLTMLSPPACNNSSCNVNFLNGSYSQITPYISLPYYINYPSILATTLAYQDYQGDYIVHYDDEEYNYSLGEVFPTYSRFISEHNVAKPEFVDFGNNSYGFVSNEISIGDISSSEVGTVNCPKNTDFINDFCYTNVYNYPTDDDVDNARLVIDFFVNNNVEYIQDHYYVFTYRFDSDTLYLPNSVSVSSGLISTTLNLENYNIINSGLYRDVQLVFKSTNSLGTGNAITYIGLLFPTLGYLTPDYNNWHYGVFKNFTITDFGTTAPTTQDLNNSYGSNNISNISSSDTSWFNRFSINDRGLSSFLTAPIRLIQRMRTSTCSAVVLPLPHFGNITLPCLKSIFQQNLPDLLTIYQLIMSGIICYYVGLNYFRIIKNAFDPEDDRIEVQNL